MIKFVYDIINHQVRKGKNAGYQHNVYDMVDNITGKGEDPV